MIEVLSQDYIRTAHAKGLSKSAVLWRHALRNALIPTVTVLGLDLAHLLGGAIITETIFAWPGVGRLTISAIFARDYPIVQAAVFLVAVGYTGINLLVDVLYAYSTPRCGFNERFFNQSYQTWRNATTLAAAGHGSIRACRTGDHVRGDAVGARPCALRPQRPGRIQAPYRPFKAGSPHLLGTDHVAATS